LEVALSAAGLFFALPAAAADLTVEIQGLRSNGGAVHFGLYDKPGGFPEYDGRIAGARTGIEDGIEGWHAVAVFKGLKPGRYALAVYHDENENGEFDRFVFGLPLEDYGFSNGAAVFFGPPSFGAAAVTVPAEGLRITIRVD
jgi:uncharacterized protein (DUF2141 family)